MISCVSWVRKGAADPAPRRYAPTAGELEVLRDAERAAREEIDDGDGDSDDDEADAVTAGPGTASKIVLPPVDAGELPPELRMDEYSSDEDEEAAQFGLASRLVGVDGDVDEAEMTEMAEMDEENGEDLDMKDGDDDVDEDEDDYLDDLPDSREYVPTNVEGLGAMNLAGTKEEKEEEEDDGSDVEDTDLRPNDVMVLAAKTEDDYASLEIYVYEPKDGNLYVHHDIVLPAFPLALAHGELSPSGAAANLCAVGTFEPGIEIWNLDVLDVLEPVCVLGGEAGAGLGAGAPIPKFSSSTSGKKKRRGRRPPPGLKPGSHADAVMALAWNGIHRQVVASASADASVKLWDITHGSGGEPAATLTHHADKVACAAWHPHEPTVLATGALDRSVGIVDARQRDSGGSRRVTLSAECEAVAWDPHHGERLTAAAEDGVVSCWDVRKMDKVLWSLVAHEGGTNGLDYNRHVPGLMTTCSIDKTVALWDASCTKAAAPVQVASKEMGGGRLFSVSFYPSDPWLLGCGGDNNLLCLWDLREEMHVRKNFPDVGAAVAAVEEVGGEKKEKDFEAMMAAGQQATATAAALETKEKVGSKKKRNKKKKKAPKKR
mmetsp:Transcript_27807/g.63691  ORF Transcript_27807/g.63691 Transcript_27807/m.63691 type:complete len:603 (-) Transcript_27807:399-2207(-)